MSLHLRQAERLHEILVRRFGAEVPSAEQILVEVPRERKFGDFSSNIALVLAKQVKANPRQLAAELAEDLAATDTIATASAAGPGFINWTLTDAAWQKTLAEIIQADSNWIFRDLGQGKAVNVEFVSANPTGPLTVGHARGAILGDVLADVLQRFGWKVEREYYINDAGNQIDTLADTILLRMREAEGEDIGEIPRGLYPGEYLKPIGVALAEQKDKVLGTCADAEARRTAAAAFAVEKIMQGVQADLTALGVRHDVFTSDKALREAGAVERAIAVLKERDLVYRGVLEPPKGEDPPEDWEPRQQLLFRATQFGDESDRPLQRSNGDWTYLAGDMAYHYDKFTRSAEKLINVWGADHVGYIPRITSALAALSDSKANLRIVVCQLVRVLRDGREVRMSKREGSFVTLGSVVEEVGRDALRFMLLTRKPSAPLDFDLSVVVKQSLENPLFYVQYAHARACSVLRLAVETFPDMPHDPSSGEITKAAVQTADLSLLTADAEREVIATLASAPQALEATLRALEPHRITAWLRALAASFHGMWQAGRADENSRFIVASDRSLSEARLALVLATRDGLGEVLRLLGVTPADRL